MNYFRSRASTLFFIALVPFFAGMAGMFFPDSVWVSVLDATSLVLAGVVIVAVSGVWYWLERRYREAHVSEVVRLREENVLFRRLFVLSFFVSCMTVVALAVVFGSKRTTVEEVSPVPFLALYGGIIAAVCLVSLLRELWRFWRGIRLVESIVAWGTVLSYRPGEERAFSFPGRIFNLGVDGGVDFVLEKEVAGLSVRLFQYSHKQQGVHAGTAHYSIVSIETRDELPSFNLGYLAGLKGSILSVFGNDVDAKLNEEISPSSEIPFIFSSGEEVRLSVARKFEIEALQIFSKELVEHFGKHWRDFFIIGTGKHLVAISDRVIKSEEELRRYDDLARFLVDAIALRLEHIGRSVTAMKGVMGGKNPDDTLE